MRLGIALLGLLCAAPLSAENKKENSNILRTGPYLGVQPGANDTAPGKTDARSQGAIRQITWVGFQMSGPGGRVFIQATETPQYDVVPSDPLEIIIELSNSRLHTRNDARPLDTTWFPTAVASVHAKQIKRNVTRVTIKLRQSVGYDLRQEGRYIFLDFRPIKRPVAPPKPATTGKG